MERPGIVDINWVVEELCAEIVGYLGRDEQSFGTNLQGWRTEKRNVVEHTRLSLVTTVMLWTTSCRHSLRSFNPWLGRVNSRTFANTPRNWLPRASRNVSDKAIDAAQASASRPSRTDDVRAFYERVSRPPMRKQVMVCI